MCLQIVNIFLVYTFPAVIRVGVVDTLGPVDRFARSTAWRATVALLKAAVVSTVVVSDEEVYFLPWISSGDRQCMPYSRIFF